MEISPHFYLMNGSRLISVMKWCLAMMLILSMLNVQASPCSCIGEANPKQALKAADRVFRGKVIHVEAFDVPVTSFGSDSNHKVPFKRYTIQIQKMLKGKILRRQIAVITGVGHGDCGFNFTEGKEDIIYATWRTQFLNDEPTVRRFLYTGICTRTTDDVEGEVKAIEAGDVSISKRK